MEATPAAMGLGNSALDQFYYAILTTVTVVENEPGSLRGPVGVPDGLAGIDTTQLAAQASLVAASASTARTEQALSAADYIDNGHGSQHASQATKAPLDVRSSPDHPAPVEHAIVR
jgi:hypothetical protein